MPRRRATLTVVVAATVVVGVAAVIGSAATGRLPLVEQAWESVTSSVESWSSPSAVQASRTGDAGARSSDAGLVARRQTAPLSSAQLGAPLIHGTFVSACGAPDDMKVVVKVTVKMGHAIGVTVKTYPSDPAVASCIDRATRDQQWDISPQTDHVTVTY
jgi:hypothetical protein